MTVKAKMTINLVIYLCMAILLAFASQTYSLGYEPGTGAAEIRPDAAGSPAALIKRHGCWTGQAPADMEGKVPGHVVVSKGSRVLYSAKLVGPALDQVFGVKDHGLVVHGFCR